MSKLNIFRITMITILLVGIVIHLLSKDFTNLLISSCLVLGLTFSALSERDKAHHTFSPISILFFVAGFIGIVAKYFYL